MRIESLHLERFGIFTDARLDFPGPHGLHLLYGPNEAGKSTVLDAITGLLFGIPERTGYGFRHDNRSLRIGAVLTGAGGRRLAVVRRKGRTNTLLTPDGSPLPDGALAPFLQGVDRDGFHRFFGLDQARLREGGARMLAAGGDLAQILFDAGSGLGHLGRVLAQLADEEDQLGGPDRRASSRPFWQSLDRYTDAQQRIRQDALKADAWQAVRDARDAALARCRGIEDELAGAQTDLARLNRLIAVVPRLGRIDRLVAARDALAPGPDLPAGFAETWRRAQQHEAASAEALARARADAAHAAAAVEGVTVPEAVLSAAAEIERLFQASGEMAGFRRDIPKRERELAELDERVGQLRRRLGVGAGAPTLPVPPRPVGARIRTRIQDLTRTGAELTAAAGAVAKARLTLGETEARLAAAAGLADPAEAAAALAEANRAGDVAGRLDEAELKLTTAGETAARALAQVAGWTGSLRALAAAAFPAPETVQRAARTADRLASERERLQAVKTDAESDQLRLHRDRVELQAVGELPTPDAVRAARATRDTAWTLVRRRHIEGVAPGPEALARIAPDGDLAARYEDLVRHADELVDRREREAARIARHAQLEADLAAAQARSAAAVADLAALEAERTAADAAYRALWAGTGVDPGPPDIMLDWLRRRDTALAALQGLDVAEQTVARLRRDAGAVLARLNHAAALLGVPTDTDIGALQARVTARLEKARADWTAAERDRADLDRQRLLLAGAEEELGTLQTRRAALERAWAADMALIGLAAAATPEEAGAALDLWDALDREAEARVALVQRIARMRADIAAHEADLETVTGMLRQGGGVPALPADRADWPGLLMHQLTAARAMAVRHAELQSRARTAAEALVLAESAWTDAVAAVGRLRQEHGLPADADPAAAAAAAAERRRLAAELLAERRELDVAGAGRAEDALRAEAAGMDPDRLHGERAPLEERVRRLQEALAERSSELALADRALADLTAREGIGAAAQAAADARAEIARHAEQIARLRVGRALLGRAVERYRARNEHPLLRRAGTLLAAMAGTGVNPVLGLTANYDDTDRPVVMAVRRDGSSCSVEGMSEGLRDQLYLALRLAAVEQRLAEGCCMPFVADDVFMAFDEERTEAGLRALAALAASTQVLVFTHHRHVVDIARRMADPVVRLVDFTLSAPAPEPAVH